MSRRLLSSGAAPRPLQLSSWQGEAERAGNQEHRGHKDIEADLKTLDA